MVLVDRTAPNVVTGVLSILNGIQPVNAAINCPPATSLCIGHYVYGHDDVDLNLTWLFALSKSVKVSAWTTESSLSSLITAYVERSTLRIMYFPEGRQAS